MSTHRCNVTCIFKEYIFQVINKKQSSQSFPKLNSKRHTWIHPPKHSSYNIDVSYQYTMSIWNCIRQTSPNTQCIIKSRKYHPSVFNDTNNTKPNSILFWSDPKFIILSVRHAMSVNQKVLDKHLPTKLEWRQLGSGLNRIREISIFTF